MSAWRLLAATATLALMGVGQAVAADMASDPYEESCRIAARMGFASQYADETAVPGRFEGSPSVSLGGAVDCHFEANWPPQLRRVVVTGCYECLVWYDDELLGSVNRRLAEYWHGQGRR